MNFIQKKALQALKTPKPESEKPLIPKRPADARDAREVARKLLKSGAIQAIQKPPTKQDQVSFKRPKGQERKKGVVDTNVSQYKPFQATSDESFQVTNNENVGERESSSHIQNLYQQFESARDRQERGIVDTKKQSLSPTNKVDSKPQARNTIFVSGNNVTEDYLRHHFQKFGAMVFVSTEIEKGKGFVTFSKPESSERAIAEMHGKAIGGIALKVELARRQPIIEPMNSASSSRAWAAVGTLCYYVHTIEISFNLKYILLLCKSSFK